MKADCYNAEGKREDSVSLPAAVFDAEYKASLLHRVLCTEQSNERQGTRQTKNRSEVSGGGRKPWRQKGTGNARQGSNRAPQWKGGGVAFGPQNRSHALGISRKMRKAGIRALLSSRAKEGAVSVLRSFRLEEYSTAKVYKLFENMGFMPGSTVAFISQSEDHYLKKSFANIRNIQLVSARRITVPQIFYAAKLVIEQEALSFLAEHYQSKSKEQPKKFAKADAGQAGEKSEVSS